MSILMSDFESYKPRFNQKKMDKFSEKINTELKDKAIIIAIEELSELVCATSKWVRFDCSSRHKNSRDKRERDRLNVLEELADATIAINIIRDKAGLTQDDLNQMIAYKLDKKFDILNSNRMARR